MTPEKWYGVLSTRKGLTMEDTQCRLNECDTHGVTTPALLTQVVTVEPVELDECGNLVQSDGQFNIYNTVCVKPAGHPGSHVDSSGHSRVSTPVFAVLFATVVVLMLLVSFGVAAIATVVR